MANCCKIIRLLKEVKRKADSSFCEINEKITKLESKYNLLSQQNEHLKKQVEENQTFRPAEAAAGALIPALVNRRKRSRRRASRHRSRPKSRPASRKSSHKSVGRKRAAKKPLAGARRTKRRGRKTAKGRKGRFRRRNPCS